MIHIKIITVGKLKENYLRDACAEYEKRLKRYADVSMIELPDEAVKENASDAECNEAVKKEGQRILSKILEKDYCIGLFIDGRKLSSETFSKEIDKLQTEGNSDVCFIIGGSNGLSSEVEKRCDKKISFSDMTFPHQLMRVILLEQIYRAFKIIKNEPYHK